MAIIISTDGSLMDTEKGAFIEYRDETDTFVTTLLHNNIICDKAEFPTLDKANGWAHLWVNQFHKYSPMH